MTPDEINLDDMPPVMDFGTLALLLLSAALGAFLAGAALPGWLPGLANTFVGAEPKAYWYLSRASALVAYGLVWLSMVLGVLITNKLARLWPGGPVAYDVHQHASLLGLVFALFHALILVGDRYIGYSLSQVLMPFASDAYRPLWVGLGQVAFYLLAIVGLSFYIRRLIGPRLWRAIHYLSFVVFGLALLHGIFSGTDSAAAGVRLFYWASGASLLFFTLYRLMTPWLRREHRPLPALKR